jgi:hypothetical protein
MHNLYCKKGKKTCSKMEHSTLNGDASCVRDPAQEAGDPGVPGWVIGAGRDRPERRDAHLDVLAIIVLEYQRAAAVTLWIFSIFLNKFFFYFQIT